MSQEHVEIVRAMLNAFDAGHRDAVLACLDENVLWVMPPLDASVSLGVEATEQGVVSWLGAWDDWAFEVVEVIEAGDAVVVVGRQRGRGKTSGTMVELDTVGAFSLRNAKIIRAEWFNTKTEALEAVGFSE